MPGRLPRELYRASTVRVQLGGALGARRTAPSPEKCVFSFFVFVFVFKYLRSKGKLRGET